jgi:hypothetical protein
LFVIDLPASHWSHVVHRIAQLPLLEILSDGEETLPDGTWFDDAWRRRLLAYQGRGCWSLRSDCRGSRHLQLYLSRSEGSEPLDLEFVFWNDLMFPSGTSRATCTERLDWLLDLAEDCRRGASEARCILAPDHNGDPREILANPETLVW